LESGARRTLATFLSHWRGDATVVAALQRELRLRGIAAWRDLTDLDYGKESSQAIRHAIRDEVDGLIALVTPMYLTRPVVWEVEIPEALERRRQEPEFQIIPLFCGVTPDDLTAHCNKLGLEDVAKFNGDFLHRVSQPKRTAALKAIARKSLRAALHLRTGKTSGYETRLLLRTDPQAPPALGVDLDLDWSEEFRAGCPPEAVWDADLKPALRDVRDEVSMLGISRKVVLTASARLSAAVALGEAFSSVAKFDLKLVGANGEWSTSASRGTARLLSHQQLAATGDPRAAIVEVSVSRAIGTSVATHAATMADPAGHVWRLEPLAGVSRNAIHDDSAAITIAWEVGDFLRRLHDVGGVRRIHLYVAAPAEWCVLLGHTLNAVGQVVVYQLDTVTGEYARACALGANWEG
jgi:SMODS-associated and fused to various effectors sensor domain/TIR domain